MGRKNIFDILEEELDVNYQIKKINSLMSEMSVGNETLEDIIDEYCIKSWKARGRYTSCAEIRDKLQITDFYLNHALTENKILLYLEYVINLIWLCNDKFIESEHDYDKEYEYLQENVCGLIEDLGYEANFFEDEEKVLLVEKNAAATAVAEIMEPSISYKVIEYNHFLLKGKIEEKRNILLALADKFEPIRPELKKVNSKLESNIGYLLNKMNIRHNNKDGKMAGGYVANLSSEELEKWYDETYQMLLLAFLEKENVERNQKIDELKKKIEG